ncbi:MAG: hypothetical protein QXP59_03830 [Saccharolobus sp.]
MPKTKSPSSEPALLLANNHPLLFFAFGMLGIFGIPFLLALLSNISFGSSLYILILIATLVVATLFAISLYDVMKFTGARKEEERKWKEEIERLRALQQIQEEKR